MAKPKTQPPVDPYSPEVIELMIEVRQAGATWPMASETCSS
jgi:hypothetical protein